MKLVCGPSYDKIWDPPGLNFQALDEDCHLANFVKGSKGSV